MGFPFWSFNLCYRIYVLNFMAWLLARVIETLVWAPENTSYKLSLLEDKPVALSIVQARLVGLAHFSVGYIFTYAAL
jgi:photosystem I P700 chlorophyll a apoprotein A2